MKKTLLLSASILFASCQTGAASTVPRFADMDTKKLYEQIDTWLNRDIVTLSVESQNAKYGKLSEEKIINLDEKWRAERESDDKPMIAATLSSPLSIYLTRMQGQSYGLFVEVFVMDDKGLNVGQSSITSDFWQGDEGKYQKTYQVGPTAIFVDEPEWDADLKIWRVQINKSLINPQNKQLIGAATIEVNLTELARRQAQ
ncbi:hypothetical protein [Cohaesibacter celericrescens]|uniref:DUF3251 domain-containing protein n=1 Tax=Cohaesibacter celericrescens TaxID=2067669 RepID=A0A2N5XL18_9HYPH|nr:hypothetical protein [Cohaesibacter celericrescens]PLW75165.1 hypothetical protein C0081_22245 [Cohaesibacter celericrescens]